MIKQLLRQFRPMGGELARPAAIDVVGISSSRNLGQPNWRANSLQIVRFKSKTPGPSEGAAVPPTTTTASAAPVKEVSKSAASKKSVKSTPSATTPTANAMVPNAVSRSSTFGATSKFSRTSKSPLSASESPSSLATKRRTFNWVNALRSISSELDDMHNSDSLKSEVIAFFRKVSVSSDVLREVPTRDLVRSVLNIARVSPPPHQAWTSVVDILAKEIVSRARSSESKMFDNSFYSVKSFLPFVQSIRRLTSADAWNVFRTQFVEDLLKDSSEGLDPKLVLMLSRMLDRSIISKLESIIFSEQTLSRLAEAMSSTLSTSSSSSSSSSSSLPFDWDRVSADASTDLALLYGLGFSKSTEASDRDLVTLFDVSAEKLKTAIAADAKNSSSSSTFSKARSTKNLIRLLYAKSMRDSKFPEWSGGAAVSMKLNGLIDGNTPLVYDSQVFSEFDSRIALGVVDQYNKKLLGSAISSSVFESVFFSPLLRDLQSKPALRGKTCKLQEKILSRIISVQSKMLDGKPSQEASGVVASMMENLIDQAADGRTGIMASDGSNVDWSLVEGILTDVNNFTQMYSSSPSFIATSQKMQNFLKEKILSTLISGPDNKFHESLPLSRAVRLAHLLYFQLPAEDPQLKQTLSKAVISSIDAKDSQQLSTELPLAGFASLGKFLLADEEKVEASPELIGLKIKLEEAFVNAFPVKSVQERPSIPTITRLHRLFADLDRATNSSSPSTALQMLDSHLNPHLAKMDPIDLYRIFTLSDFIRKDVAIEICQRGKELNKLAFPEQLKLMYASAGVLSKQEPASSSLPQTPSFLLPSDVDSQLREITEQWRADELSGDKGKATIAQGKMEDLDRIARIAFRLGWQQEFEQVTNQIVHRLSSKIDPSDNSNAVTSAFRWIKARLAYEQSSGEGGNDVNYPKDFGTVPSTAFLSQVTSLLASKTAHQALDLQSTFDLAAFLPHNSRQALFETTPAIIQVLAQEIEKRPELAFRFFGDLRTQRQQQQNSEDLSENEISALNILGKAIVQQLSDGRQQTATLTDRTVLNCLITLRQWRAKLEDSSSLERTLINAFGEYIQKQLVSATSSPNFADPETLINMANILESLGYAPASRITKHVQNQILNASAGDNLTILSKFELLRLVAPSDETSRIRLVEMILSHHTDAGIEPKEFLAIVRTCSRINGSLGARQDELMDWIAAAGARMMDRLTLEQAFKVAKLVSVAHFTSQLMDASSGSNKKVGTDLQLQFFDKLSSEIVARKSSAGGDGMYDSNGSLVQAQAWISCLSSFARMSYVTNADVVYSSLEQLASNGSVFQDQAVMMGLVSFLSKDEIISTVMTNSNLFSLISSMCERFRQTLTQSASTLSVEDMQQVNKVFDNYLDIKTKGATGWF